MSSSNQNNNNPPAWGFFTNNFRVTILLLVAIVVLGVFSIFQMPQESNPEIDVPIAVITTTLPGGSATDVEQLVTNPIEDNIENLSDLTELTSTSETGFSQITAQFEVGIDSSEAIADLRNEVDTARNELPDDANDPNVQEISFSDQPVVTYAVSGPYDLQQLGGYAEAIADEFSMIANVSDSNVSGNPDTEFAIEISQSDLAQYGLSIGQVISQLQQANTDTPIGSVSTDESVYTVRFAGRLENLSDIRSVPVKSENGVVVQLGEIAEVNQQPEALSVRNQFATDGELQPAVSIDIFKESGVGSIVSVVDEAESMLADTASLGIPDDVTISATRNRADQIASDLSNLLSSGFITMIIIFTVLVLFLGWREAVLASLSIPISFLLGLIGLYVLGYTINSLTLFSLILVVGILVDAAIVITESFSERLERGLEPTQAAFATLREFQAPLTAGTLTTVFAFAPMLLAGGIIGQFIGTIPVTVSAVLISALFVSLGLIPAFAATFFRTVGEGNSLTRWTKRRISDIYSRYSDLLSYVLRNSGWRTAIFSVMFMLFIGAVALPITGNLKTTLFPPPDLDTISINMEMPSGTPLDVTNSEVTDVAEEVQQKSYVASVLASTGAGANPGLVTTGGGSTNEGGAVVSLRPADQRELPSKRIVSQLNDQLPQVTEAEVEVSQQSGGPPTGKPVQINLTEGSLEDLETAADRVVDTLAETSGAENIESELSTGSSELVVTVDRSAVSRSGITPRTVANTLRARVSGVEATTVKTDGDDIPVRLQYPDTRPESGFGQAGQVSVDQVNGTVIQTQSGSVPLANVTSLNLGQRLPSISHTEGDRQFSVSADTSATATAAGILQQFKDKFNEDQLPESVSVSYGGQQEDVQDSFTDLFLAMILGVILIFALLTYQFKSYAQPLYMLATIPLSFIGVAFGLAAVGQPLSFPAFIGVVALAGIVVNNAIILIDRINTARQTAVDIDTAILEGAKSRVQPIILTTITTAGGVAPLLFTDPTWMPLAWAIIFGLSFSTILTLVVVPLLYQRFSTTREDM